MEKTVHLKGLELTIEMEENQCDNEVATIPHSKLHGYALFSLYWVSKEDQVFTLAYMDRMQGNKQIHHMDTRSQAELKAQEEWQTAVQLEADQPEPTIWEMSDTSCGEESGQEQRELE